jgi:hypothetical protein
MTPTTRAQPGMRPPRAAATDAAIINVLAPTPPLASQ